MFGFLDRYFLIKKGLASPKTRRRRTRSELRETLRTGVMAKAGIFAAFVTGLAVLICWGGASQSAERFFTAMLIFLTALAQLWINHPRTFADNSRILLMFGTFLVHLGLTKAGLALVTDGTVGPQFAALIIPYALAPLVCSVLLGKNQGLYAATFVSLWGAVIYSGTSYRIFEPATYLVTSLICGFIAVFVTLEVRRRTRLIRAGFFVGLALWMLALTLRQIKIPWELFPALDWNQIGILTLAAIANGIFTAVLVSGLVPMLEWLFGITTNISWLEAADLNHPLLKRLTIEAPGTYHHSLVVANLAEAAAEAIGANPLASRVCSYFHDIGKLVKPEYFTENMSNEVNPHDGLTPTMSALIIVAHVKEGVDLALKHRLNRQIIDIIQQHHGTSLVRYFHQRALQQQEDARRGGKIMNMREDDIPEVREESFRYPGPRPQTRESGIISLADAVESASRSIERITPQRIEQVINDIIEQRILDGQLDESPLTLRELRAIAESFRFTLQGMMHSRIGYPAESKTGREVDMNRPASAPPMSAA
jgi:cyclic-di-AMP phosphodiesterase PgpH